MSSPVTKIDGVDVETIEHRCLKPVDGDLLNALLAAGFGSSANADTLVQAAAIVTVHRHHAHGESMGERGKDFAEVLKINQLHYAQPQGRA